MPEDGLEQLRPFDAILLGAVGAPEVPDHVSLWGLLIPIRRDFDQYVNLRPVRLLPGIKSPLAGRTPQDIDFVIIRENTEGEYSQIGGRLYQGMEGRSWCRSPSSPAAGWTGSSASLSSSHAAGRRST